MSGWELGECIVCIYTEPDPPSIIDMLLCVVSGLRRYNKQNTGLVVCHCHTVKLFVLNENTYLRMYVSLCVYVHSQPFPFIGNRSDVEPVTHGFLSRHYTSAVACTQAHAGILKHNLSHSFYSIFTLSGTCCGNEGIRTGSHRVEWRSGRYKKAYHIAILRAFERKFIKYQ